jgi:DNA polymerase III delta prime subunit
MAEATTPTTSPPPALKLAVYKPEVDMQHLKILIYGPPGVGKTTLAASAQAVKSMQEVLMVNIEGGMLSITDPAVYKAANVPDVVDLENFDFVTQLFRYLRAPGHKYKTVVIDSLSELNKVNLDDVIAKKRAAGGKNASADDVFLEDYGTNTKQMRRVVRGFRDLPLNVIMTCHDAPNDNEPNSVIGPALTKSLRKSD